MSDIGQALTVEICSACGARAGASAHGHPGAPGWLWKRVRYVPSEQLTGAEDVLREILAAAKDVTQVRNADAAERWYRALDRGEAILSHG